MNKHKKNFSAEFNDSFLNENALIFKKYKPIKVIGSGAFSKIYSTIRISDKSVFAMKTEKKSLFKNLLEEEAYYLFTLREGFGIPKLISFGHNRNYNILIETLLGKSLQDIFIVSKKPCNLNDLCLIAIQLIERLEFIHSKNIIYRDIKPENLMIGLNDPNVIYIVDFGLCKKYRSSKSGKHIQLKDTKKFNGTLKYASSNVLQGKEASRRDDLISLGFTLLFLYKRNLPWESNWKKLNKITYLYMINSKQTFDSGKLFENLPDEMVVFLKYIQNLRFDQDPDYAYMKGCFQNILTKMSLNMNKINFSWINQNDIKSTRRVNSTGRKLFRERIIKMLEDISVSKEKNKAIRIINRSAIASNNINYQNNPKKINHLIIKRKTKKIIKDDSINRNNERKHKSINIEYPTSRGKINNIKNLIYLRNKSNFNHMTNNSLVNNTKIINDNNRKVLQNIYINTNSNIFLNNINLESNLKNNLKLNIKYNTKFNNYYTQNNNISNSLVDNQSRISYFNNNYSLNKSRYLNSNNIESSTLSFLNTSQKDDNYINNFINKPKLYKSKILKSISHLNIYSPNTRLINKLYATNNNVKNIQNKRDIKNNIPKPKTFRLKTNSFNF